MIVLVVVIITAAAGFVIPVIIVVIIVIPTAVIVVVVIVVIVLASLAWAVFVVLIVVIEPRHIDEGPGAFADPKTGCRVLAHANLLGLLLNDLPGCTVPHHFELFRSVDRLDLGLTKSIDDFDPLKAFCGEIRNDLIVEALRMGCRAGDGCGKGCNQCPFHVDVLSNSNRLRRFTRNGA